MKRIHIGLSVQDLDQSVAYYTALFGEDPVVREPDYAKWTPSEPFVNLSVTTRSSGETYPVHFGIDVTAKEDLMEISERLEQRGVKTVDEGETICCYHRSTKTWASDPDRFAWEVFLTSGREAEFGKGPVSQSPAATAGGQACCESTCCGEEDAA